MKNTKYIYLLIAIAALLNAVMDQFGFRLNDYGWEWHLVKIVMQGCYAFAIGFALNFKKLKSWVYFLIAFALITLVFHDAPYHYLFK